MKHDPFNENKLNIRPEQLWNAAAMIQQAVMMMVMIVVYTLVRIMVHSTPGKYTGIEHWLEQLHALFRLNTLPSDILLGAAAGFALAFVLLLLDAGVALIRKKNVKLWLHRSDYILPENKRQRRWALSVALVGSAVEELMFRGFIFLAILPLWNTWIWSALLLSAVFSLLHAAVQGLWSTIWIFIAGFLLCFFVVYGKSIYFIFFVHAMLNIANLFILPPLMKRRAA
ncbi:MAG: CPBP family intramembrane metalloprotease [FCB group bacterium]|nr:CPBP family intramembrane metalloprotease [FCB group bacterium]